MLYTVYTHEQLKQCLFESNATMKRIGFVPTMGALHQGHLELIKFARATCDIVVCSIFVNPTQFNNPTDLDRYPRTVAADRLLLYKAQCDILFLPEVNEIYPDGLNLIPLPLNDLDKVMEGIYRPGHFAGMVTVVHRLFEIVKPQVAFFGEKDFQQLAIIKYMVKTLNLPIEIVGCNTIREADGLAMSSRNIHLTNAERAEASIIFKTLVSCAELKNNHLPDALQHLVKERIESSNLFKLEYVSFINAITLQSLKNWLEMPQRVCIAVTTSKTRLIDNMPL
jgi:pantoate--beta-alanine ligase